MSDQQAKNDALWRAFMLEGEEKFNYGRKWLALLPSNPRCKFCNAPFEGVGSVIVRMAYGKSRSNMNPSMCNVCETHARTHPGGAEIELTMLFADVRGSTGLAERVSPSEFTRLMNRFYSAATDAIARHDGLINRFVGDEAIGFFVPGIAGASHAAKTIEAARALMRATGNDGSGKAWLPVGVGIHTGVAYVGAVGTEGGVVDITALGDPVNVTARLASNAGAGELLVSEAACAKAGVNVDGLEQRMLELKGREERVAVRVMLARAH